MKNVFKRILSIVLLVTVFIACSKGDGNEKQSDTNVLIKANDNNSLGKYSGILLGSSGYFTIELRENGSVATIIFDAKTYTILGTSSLVSGQKITNYTFEKDGIMLTITVDADGKNPKVKVEIPGHTVTSTIVKETTTYETGQYVGTVTDPEQGDFPAALTLWDFKIQGYLVSDNKTGDHSIRNPFSGELDAGTQYKITFPDLPGHIFSVIVSNGKITGGGNVDGTQLIFNLSKVN